MEDHQLRRLIFATGILLRGRNYIIIDSSARKHFRGDKCASEKIVRGSELAEWWRRNDWLQRWLVSQNKMTHFHSWHQSSVFELEHRPELNFFQDQLTATSSMIDICLLMSSRFNYIVVLSMTTKPVCDNRKLGNSHTRAYKIRDQITRWIKYRLDLDIRI